MPPGKRQTILHDRLEGEVLRVLPSASSPSISQRRSFTRNRSCTVEYPERLSLRRIDILQPQQRPFG